jgi:uncharacterized protein YqjF (DUF2071 family)
MNEIDRLAPAQRPDGKVVMQPGWHDLLFLHWPVPPETVGHLLPQGLELDTYAGYAWIGLVPFTMTRVRPNWAPRVSFSRELYEDFHETNVRTYVHCNGQSGVWFFSLDAASAPAVAAARAWYKLPYFWSRMSLKHKADGSVAYTSRRLTLPPVPATLNVKARPYGAIFQSTVGSLEHFLVERYILYSQAKGRLFRGRVHHQPYQVRWAEVISCEENLIAAAGLSNPGTKPHALYSRGVNVDIFALESVDK